MSLGKLFRKWRGKRNDGPPTPTEGELFKVIPGELDKTRFETPRSDEEQEWTRKVILDALEKVSEEPQRYGEPFYTLMPGGNKWRGRIPVRLLLGYAKNEGGHLANWVEQSLEWAQRIQNGESWEDICNKEDTAQWQRVIKVRCGYQRIGGSRKKRIRKPPTYTERGLMNRDDITWDVQPLIVIPVKK